MRRKRKRSSNISQPIVRQPVPPEYQRKAFVGARRRRAILKSGESYDFAARNLRYQIFPWVRGPRKLNTIMAFVNNYYVKYQELPALEDLRKIFKF